MVRSADDVYMNCSTSLKACDQSKRMTYYCVTFSVIYSFIYCICPWVSDWLSEMLCYD